MGSEARSYTEDSADFGITLVGNEANRFCGRSMR